MIAVLVASSVGLASQHGTVRRGRLQVGDHCISLMAVPSVSLPA
jgi:hypothetical protein